MEFPPEIVALIREYSMPRFQHFEEYKRLVKRCGPMPKLKKKLDQGLLPNFLMYETAVVKWREPKYHYIRMEMLRAQL